MAIDTGDILSPVKFTLTKRNNVRLVTNCLFPYLLVAPVHDAESVESPRRSKPMVLTQQIDNLWNVQLCWRGNHDLCENTNSLSHEKQSSMFTG